MRFSNSSLLKGLALLLSLSLNACDADEEKPQEGTVDIGVSLFSTAALQGRLVINEAVMNISRIDLTAISLGKNTIHDTQELVETDQVFVLTGRASAPQVQLNATAGEYDPFSLKITPVSNPYNLVATDDNGVKSINYQEFLDNSKPALLLKGYFESRGINIPVVIAVDDILPLQVSANMYGTEAIQIGAENLAQIQLNPAAWFQDISPQMLENASRINYQNQEIIFINDQWNSLLYNKILLAIETPEKSMNLDITVTKGTD